MDGAKLVIGLLGLTVAADVARRNGIWSDRFSGWTVDGRVLDCESRQVLSGRPSADLVARARKRGPGAPIAAQRRAGVWEYVQEDGLDPHWALENGVIAVCVE